MNLYIEARVTILALLIYNTYEIPRRKLLNSKWLIYAKLIVRSVAEGVSLNEVLETERSVYVCVRVGGQLCPKTTLQTLSMRQLLFEEV